jgi:hypothetical protein
MAGKFGDIIKPTSTNMDWSLVFYYRYEVNDLIWLFDEPDDPDEYISPVAEKAECPICYEVRCVSRLDCNHTLCIKCRWRLDGCYGFKCVG